MALCYDFIIENLMEGENMKNHDKIRALFPICSVKTYFEAGLSNGGCTLAKDAVDLYFEESFTGVLDGKKQWNEATEEVRKLASQLLGGVNADNIAITKNTVEGLNIIAQGFPFESGDNVVINSDEHISNVMPWLALKDKGVEIRIVPSENHKLSPEIIEKYIDNKTKIVAISHVQAPTGYTCNIKTLAEICHKNDAFLVVDAIQSLGLIEVNAQDWGIDAVSSGAHKNLLGMTGTGLLYVAPQLMSKLTPHYAGSSSVRSFDRSTWENTLKDENNARKFELSNLNYPGIYALRATLTFILEVGIDEISAHVKALSKRMNEGLREIGYDVATPLEESERAGITSVVVPDLAHMKAWFGERNIAISKMDLGFVRFAVGIFSKDEDVDIALEYARKYYGEFVK